MFITHLDHFVLTVADIERTVEFYTRAFGMERIEFGEGRVALAFGCQKINLHLAGHELEPKAAHPTPGSADVCLITELAIADVVELLSISGVVIELGPVPRTGASGPITSIYLRDPDQNLIEIAQYDL